MRKVWHFLLVIITTILLYNYPLIKYGLGQAYGQLSIIYQAEDIDDYVKKESVSDSIKSKLLFVEEVRKYAVDSLGLNESDNYTTIFDQKGQPILWVVTGSKPYKFEAKEWKFPLLGSVPYKGFFNQNLASQEFILVQEQGFDAGMRTVGGWSTLGWFKDPILSNMLQRNYGELANLIIHELVHATVFVKDSVEFNENLASFIADKAAIKFMTQRFGVQSQEFSEYTDQQHDEKLFINHMLSGVSSLEELYISIEGDSSAVKRAKKNKAIEKIMNATDTLSLRNTDYLSFLKGQLPNNTYFMSFLRYRSKQEVLDSMYVDQFDQQIRPFVDYLKEKHPYIM